MKYIIYNILFVLICLSFQYIIKTNKTDILLISLISSITVFIFYVFKFFYYENRTKEQFKSLLLNKKVIAYLSISGTITYLINKYIVRFLPFSLSIGLLNIWILTTLFFQKVMLNYSVTNEVLLLYILFFVSLLLFNLNKLNDFKKINKNYIISIILVLISAFARGFQVTYIKKLTEIQSETDIIIMDFIGIMSISIILVLLFCKNFKIDKPLYILWFAIFQFIASYLRFTSINNLSENLFVLITQTQVIFSFLIGYFIFKEKLHLSQIIGGIMMITIIYLINIYDNKLSNNHHHL